MNAKGTQLRLTLVFLTFFLKFSSQQCIVDRCLVCPDNTTLTCTNCESGYYLRSFTGGAQPYQACWSTTKLIWLVLGSILGLISLCCCFYACYRLGLRAKPNPYSNKEYGMDMMGANFTNRSPREPIARQRPIAQSPRARYPGRGYSQSPRTLVKTPRRQMGRPSRPAGYRGQTPGRVSRRTPGRGGPRRVPGRAQAKRIPNPYEQNPQNKSPYQYKSGNRSTPRQEANQGTPGSQNRNVTTGKQ
jgi:hypothetical protein